MLSCLAAYRHVRRYGFSESSFTLEAGHRAGSASGVFIFKNCLGSQIRDAMELKMKAMIDKQKQHSDDYAYAMLPGNDAAAQIHRNEKTSSPTLNNKNNSGSTGHKYANETMIVKTTKPIVPIPAPKTAKRSPPPDAGEKATSPGVKTAPLVTVGGYDAVDAAHAPPTMNGKPPATVSKATPQHSPHGGRPAVQPKMSEIANMLSKHRQQQAAMNPVGEDDDPYGYSHIDIQKSGSHPIVGGGSASTVPDGGSNLYGQQQMRQLMQADEECAYAEIGYDPK